MPDEQISDEIRIVQEMMQDLGYRAQLSDDKTTIRSTTAGLRFSIIPRNGTMQFYLSMSNSDLTFALDNLNIFNQKYRFCKVYLDRDNDFALETDHIFDEKAEGAVEHFKKIIDLWEGTIALLREYIRELDEKRIAAASAENAPG